MNSMNNFNLIEQQIKEKALVWGRQPEEITLVAVSKTHSVALVQSVYEAGARDFGESRVQEALDKISVLPSNCCWHFIGTLQSNKISKVISYFNLIHSVDTPLLAQKISQASQLKNVQTSILLQVNTSGELTKHGLKGEKWEYHLETLNHLPNLQIEGLMTMAPFTQNETEIRSCFRQLYQWREKWQSRMKNPLIFQHLSMGMSQDYLIAIEEGATLLRIGSAIFGQR